jgi:propionaldehyde dehydrogenase
MAEIDEARIREIVAHVVANLAEWRDTPATPERASDSRREGVPAVTGHGVFETPDAAVAAARAAQRELAASTLDLRKRILQAMRDCGRGHARELAEVAVEETGMGRVEHKTLKNEAAADLTPGVEDIHSEATTGDQGALIVEYAPIGTLNAITPTTNPTSTVINNAIILLAAGNAVVFAPHPRAARCTLQTMTYLNDAIVQAGGPRNLLTAVSAPSLRHAKTIMEHPDIDAIVATGGAGVVRVALSAGKKAFAAGPGNPCVIVDETADIARAARAVTDGASFDNNLLCIGEKECFVLDVVADAFLREMGKCGCYILKPHELPLLMNAVVKDGHPNPELIGKDASVILAAAGIRAPNDALVAVVETKAEHLLVMEEFLMPILPVVRVKAFEEAVRCAVVAEGGRQHTAVLHTARMDRVQTFAQAVQCSIFVVNGPSTACAGIGGEGFLAMTVAGKTGEGFTRPRHFTNERRMTLVNTLSIHTRA